MRRWLAPDLTEDEWYALEQINALSWSPACNQGEPAERKPRAKRPKADPAQSRLSFEKPT